MDWGLEKGGGGRERGGGGGYIHINIRSIYTWRST